MATGIEATLPPFSEEYRCPKCGCNSRVVYHCIRRLSEYEGQLSCEVSWPHGPGHLHQQCGRCNWTNFARPLDAVGDAPAAGGQR